MGDLLSDVAKEHRELRRYKEFLEILKAFILDPTPENHQKVISRTNDVRHYLEGIFGRRFEVKDVERVLNALKARDGEAWAKLLFNLDEEFTVFKMLSPFAGKLVILVDYSPRGGVYIKGDIEPLMDDIIGTDKGLRLYDGDKYLVTTTFPNRRSAEVIWVGSSYLGRSAPQPKK